MSDGVISIDVELNEKEFQTVLENMGLIIKNGSDVMIQSVDNLGRNFALLPNNMDTAFKTVPFLVNGLINSISSQSTDMAEAGSNLFNSISDSIPEAAINISGKIPEINSRIIDTFASFSPDISNAGFNLFASLTDGLPNAMTGIVEKVPQIPLEISGKIDESRERMSETGFNLFSSLTDGLPNAVTGIVEKVPQIPLEISGKIDESRERMSETGFNLFTSLTDGLTNAVTGIVEKVPQIPLEISGKIDESRERMSETGFNLFSSLTDGLPNAVTGIVEKVPQIPLEISGKVDEGKERMSETGFNLFTSLTDGLPNAVTGIVEKVPQIPLEISSKIDEGREFMSETGFNLFSSLADNLPGAVEIISQAPGVIVDAVIGGFTGLLFRFNEIGKNIVQGVWAGIASMASWLASQISGFFQGIVGGITSLLGIQSPSTLFKDKIGKNIALGVGAGIAEEMPKVADDMLKYVNAVVVNAERGASKLNLNNFIDSVISQGYSSGVIKNNDLRADRTDINNNGEVSSLTPNVNITIEPSGDIRGFFDYLSMNIKRADYLSGGAGI